MEETVREGKLKELSRDLDFVNNLLEKRNIKKKQKDDNKKAGRKI